MNAETVPTAPPKKARRKARLLPMPTATRVAAEPSPAVSSALRPVLAHTMDEVAVQIRRSTRHVRRLIKSGRLKAKLDGRMVLVLDVDLQQFLAALPSAI